MIFREQCYGLIFGLPARSRDWNCVSRSIKNNRDSLSSMYNEFDGQLGKVLNPSHELSCRPQDFPSKKITAQSGLASANGRKTFAQSVSVTEYIRDKRAVSAHKTAWISSKNTPDVISTHPHVIFASEKPSAKHSLQERARDRHRGHPVIARILSDRVNDIEHTDNKCGPERFVFREAGEFELRFERAYKARDQYASADARRMECLTRQWKEVRRGAKHLLRKGQPHRLSVQSIEIVDERLVYQLLYAA
ncbi:hypothetical protein BJ912DRAFT_921630 [Pholiota molesta]|nr:hypothetical protein BJ912DRAFT_921630 [Pholiota molesta]